MVRRNCFAYKNGECDALKKIGCEKCSFFQIKAFANEKIVKANVRRVELGYEPRQLFK